jgi:hypothetical protein
MLVRLFAIALVSGAHRFVSGPLFQRFSLQVAIGAFDLGGIVATAATLDELLSEVFPHLFSCNLLV